MSNETMRVELTEETLSDGSKGYGVKVSYVQWDSTPATGRYPVTTTALHLDALDERHADALVDALSIAIRAHTNEIVA